VTEKELADALKRNPDLRIVQGDDTAPLKPPIVGTSSDAMVRRFEELWLAAGGPELATEHRFHPERRWRFDYAHLASKTAIEINGGIWSGGRHIRGAGYLRDREKVNTAQMLGWKVFELGTGQVTPANVQAIINHVTEVTVK